MTLHELEQSKANPGFMGVNHWGSEFALTTAASTWQAEQGDKFKTRRDDFVGGCRPCVAFWNLEGTEQEQIRRREAFVVAWDELEKMGFPDTAAVGHKVPRTAWATFTKTEKGWAAAK